jgi:hypothetical protein
LCFKSFQKEKQMDGEGKENGNGCESGRRKILGRK